MADLEMIATGVYWFIFGWAFTVVSYYVVPQMIDFLPTDTLKGIFWLSLICLWVGATTLVPAAYVIQGARA